MIPPVSGNSISGHLHLRCESREDGVPYIASQSFRAPVHLSKSHLDANRLVLSIVNPTAGFFDGDKLETDITVGKNASLVLSTPSASRVYQTRSGSAATSEQIFRIGENAMFEWIPEPFIPHAGASYVQRTRISLHPSASLLFFDWIAPGRVAKGEIFAYQQLRWELDLEVGETLVARERYDLRPETSSLEALRAKYPAAHSLTIYAAGALAADWPDSALDELTGEDVYLGHGPLPGGVRIIRALCRDSLSTRKLLETLRPLLLLVHWDDTSETRKDFHVNAPTTAHRLAARERPHGFPVMRQSWEGLLFLHWPMDPAGIAEKLPRGLHVDTFQGEAWLGIVPFFMKRVRPVGLPPIPWLSWFLELNVRTYVHDDAGNPGVWFFSLECNQPVAVEIARRFFHLPYMHSSMEATVSGSRVRYRSHRRGSIAGPAEFDYQLATATAVAREESLEWFLVERYLLFSAAPDGGLFCGRVHHAPYQIAPAECGSWSTKPMLLDGFPEPAVAPPSMLAAAPVDVTIYPLKRC